MRGACPRLPLDFGFLENQEHVLYFYHPQYVTRCSTHSRYEMYFVLMEIIDLLHQREFHVTARV